MSAAILLLDETKGLLEFGTSRGFQSSTLRFTSLRIGQGMAGRAALQHQVIHIRDLRIDPQSLVMPRHWQRKALSVTSPLRSLPRDR